MLDFLLLAFKGAIVMVCSVLIVISLVLFVTLVYKEVIYIKNKIKYGKIEGVIIYKDKEFGIRPGPVSPFDYYVVIEKEKDGEKITRKLYISDREYDTLNEGDYISKKGFNCIEKK